MNRKFLHFLSLLLLMLCSTGTWAADKTVTADLSKWSVNNGTGGSTSVDENGVAVIAIGTTKGNAVTLTSDQSYSGIKSISFTIQTSDRGKQSFKIEVSSTSDFSSVSKTFESSYDETAKALKIGTASVSSNNSNATGSVALDDAVDGYVRITAAQASGSSGKSAKVTNVKITYTAEDKTVASESFAGLKVNGVDLDESQYTTSGNTFTLSGSYLLNAPVVKLKKVITYTDNSTENDVVDVTFALNLAENVFAGSATIGSTEYTVNASVGTLSTALASVSESTTWDWTKTGTKEVLLDEMTYPSTKDEFVLGNLIESTSDFNSNALCAQCQYVVRDNKYFQGGKIKFTTTVPGTIKVSFSNTGNRYVNGKSENGEDESLRRYLYVNGTKTEWGSCISNAGDKVTGEIPVAAGDVELTSFIDGNDAAQYIRIYSIEFTKTESQDPDPSSKVFRNIALDMSQAGILTAEEAHENYRNNPISFGVKIAENGDMSRVEADDADANISISGKANDVHGLNSAVATFPVVAGSYKVTIGSCSWGSNATVKNGETVLATVNTNKGACYHNNRTDNVVVCYATVAEDAILTVSGAGYLPFIGVESINPEDIPTERTVSFTAGDATGKAPENIVVENGSDVTVPLNRTLYKEGYTLTGWSDGTNTYTVGQTVSSVTADVELSPVFTANTKSIDNHSEAVTLLWDFQRKNGAPVLNYGGNHSGIYVTQATVDGEVIDVKMDYNTKTGKLANGAWDNWAQLNGGFEFYLPSANGAEVSMEIYNASVETTVDGVALADNTVTTPSVTVASDNNPITVVYGADASYFRWIKVVLPESKDDSTPEPAVFRDFSAILSDAEGTLLTAEELVQGTSVEFGIAVAEDGTVSRVDKNAANAIAVISGRYHSAHGLENFSMTVKVDGGVKIGMGKCGWGGDVKVNGTVNFSTYEKDVCWHNDKVNNIAYGHYTGEAGEITISGGKYTPFISIAAETVTSCNVTYSLGDVECEGTQVPQSVEVVGGESTKVPANYTLYKEGHTLTGWTDGSNTYAVGSDMTPTSDVTLTPVFTANTVSLADRTAPVTVMWNFRRDQGAPVVAYEGKSGIYVTQANVNGETIDVKLSFTTSPGKFNNSGHEDWVQINEGTTFTIPSCKGAVVSLESYSATTSTTIDGLTEYETAGTVVSAEIASKSETIDIVIGDGSYYRYIKTVLPKVEAPVSNLKEKLLYSTDFATDWAQAASADANKVKVTTSDKNEIEFALHYTSVEPAKWDEIKFKAPATTGALNAEKNKGATITTSVIPSVTKVSWVHCATGSKRGWGLKVKGDGDEDWVTLHSAVADPSSGQLVNVDVNRTNVQLQFYNLANDQNAFMTNLEISGMVEVLGETYIIAAAPDSEEAGSVSIYPKSDDYTEGDEVTLTAVENFGYDFVNWTNAAGEEVSKDAKYKYSVVANETFTANFVKVDTYALNLIMDGGANDYMISYNPAPVVVEGKNMYEAGTKVTLTASENKIMTFNNWGDLLTEKEIVITMDGDKDVTAVYSAKDFIVAWDFYKAGNNGRAADFAAADNDDVTLNLRDAQGNIVGWLDKSQVAAGGYEGRPGAVNWVEGEIGAYYWQTKINAEAFTDIVVETSMVYNYSAYKTYSVDASLDGENWETVGQVKMTGAKNWADAKIELGEKYNNQKSIYLRWIADKTSSIDGSSSTKDGACLGATYITGTAKLVDDGKAPVLVSTVPANATTGASANGKVVLTFDEKVKVSEGAEAKLGTKTLVPSVSGKVVAFEYTGLEYSTEYTFTLPANSVADLTDNYLAEAISISFSTKTKPEVVKGEGYDVVILSTDEYSNPLTAEQMGKQLADAIDAANKRADKTKRFRIFLAPGTYKIPASDQDMTVTQEVGSGKVKTPFTYKDPRTFITGDNISIIGLDYKNTIITNTTPVETFPNAFGQNANVSEGIGNNDVFQISGKNVYFQGVTIKTGIGDNGGRDLAIHDKGDKTIFKNTCLWGYQDTYTNNNGNGRTYFENGVVRGRTDYLCGKADIWFEGVTLQQCGQGGYPIVPSTPRKYGWIFNNCTLTPETKNVTCTLGRPWGSGTPIALLINTKMEVIPSAEGWSEMSGGWPARFAEYNSTTASGTTIDLSSRKKTFGGKTDCNNPILTAAEASEYTIAKVMGDGDNWDPTAATEQASAPTNAFVSKDGTLSWDNSNYVFGWMLLYQLTDDSEIVPFGFANTNSVNFLDDDAAKAKLMGDIDAENAANDIELKHMYVAGVNEMGGVGALTEFVADPADGISATGISVVANGKIYNIAGQQVSKAHKGIKIQNGKKFMK